MSFVNVFGGDSLGRFFSGSDIWVGFWRVRSLIDGKKYGVFVGRGNYKVKICLEKVLERKWVLGYVLK